jgi:GT2 family glycosyltransferase
VRNFWLKQAKGEFIQLFDDDNEVAPDFLEKCLKKREEKTTETKSECVILPSLYYRDTNQIQNQWFSRFDYRQSRPILHLLDWKNEAQIQMFSWNWIFSKASTLRKSKYDEQIARISEDLDYTLSLHEQWVQLRVFSDLKVIHHERDKTKLEQARIGSYSQAKQKARNWFLFTKKHWNKNQIRQFYLCWLPWCMLRLSVKAILFWGKGRFKIIKWLFDWVKEWYKLTHKKEK